MYASVTDESSEANFSSGSDPASAGATSAKIDAGPTTLVTSGSASISAVALAIAAFNAASTTGDSFWRRSTMLSCALGRPAASKRA